MGGGSNLGNTLKNLYIGRAMIKLVVAYDTTIGLTTGGAILFFIKLLEERALFPGRAFELLEEFRDIFFGDIQDTNLELFVGLRIGYHVLQAAPGTFQFLKVFVVNNCIHRFRQLIVKVSHQKLDRRGRIGGIYFPFLKRFASQR